MERPEGIALFLKVDLLIRLCVGILQTSYELLTIITFVGVPYAMTGGDFLRSLIVVKDRLL